MVLFVFVWIASWIGSFLSTNQSLPQSAKSSQNLGKSVVRASLLPASFLKIDLEKKKSAALTIAQAPDYSQSDDDKRQNKLCNIVAGSLSEQPQPQAVSSLPMVYTRHTKPDFFLDKFLLSLQSFFHFSNLFEQAVNPPSLPIALVHRNEQDYEVWVNNHLVANLPDEWKAKSMQQRLTQLLLTPRLDASQLRPGFVDGIPALMAGNRFLFGIDTQISQKFNSNSELLAIEWTNNLRQALHQRALSLVEGQMSMYDLKPSDQKISGLASWYGGYFQGRLTANGETYNQDDLTVANKSLPFNTYLEVTNMNTQKAVIVRVNDRGPYIPPRSLDLSRQAARCIDSETTGVIPYEAVVLEKKEPKIALNESNFLRKQKVSVASEN